MLNLQEGAMDTISLQGSLKASCFSVSAVCERNTFLFLVGSSLPSYPRQLSSPKQCTGVWGWHLYEHPGPMARYFVSRDTAENSAR